MTNYRNIQVLTLRVSTTSHPEGEALFAKAAGQEGIIQFVRLPVSATSTTC